MWLAVLKARHDPTSLLIDFFFTEDEIEGYGTPTITYLFWLRQGGLYHTTKDRARSSLQCDM